MSKSIRECLKELPSDAAVLAINNVMAYNKEMDELTEKAFIDRATAPSLASAMLCSFNWKDSPEGHDYWYKIYEMYK